MELEVKFIFKRSINHHTGRCESRVTVVLPATEDGYLHPSITDGNQIVGGNALSSTWGEPPVDEDDRYRRKVSERMTATTWEDVVAMEQEFIEELRLQLDDVYASNKEKQGFMPVLEATYPIG